MAVQAHGISAQGSNNVLALKTQFAKQKAAQGILGRSVDFLASVLGASGDHSTYDPRRLWNRYVLDYDTSSAGLSQAFLQGKSPQELKKRLDQYQVHQASMVNGLIDTACAITGGLSQAVGVAFSVPTLGTSLVASTAVAAGVGGATKVGLKALDAATAAQPQQYQATVRDVATGALSGGLSVLAPVASGWLGKNLASKGVGQTASWVAEKFGQGAIWGGSTQGVDAALNGDTLAAASPKVLTGALLGGTLGLAADVATGGFSKLAKQAQSLSKQPLSTIPEATVPSKKLGFVSAKATSQSTAVGQTALEPQPPTFLAKPTLEAQAIMKRYQETSGLKDVPWTGVSTSSAPNHVPETAATYTVGGQPVVEVGLNSWEALTHPQRQALLGHELGHTVRGDLNWLGWADTARDVAHVALLPVDYLSKGLSIPGHGLVEGVYRWFRRHVEKRADLTALQLMKQAGVSDPAGALIGTLNVVEQIKPPSASTGFKVPEWFDTYPSTQTRIKAIEQWRALEGQLGATA